jgi:hypothetical protein
MLIGNVVIAIFKLVQYVRRGERPFAPTIFAPQQTEKCYTLSKVSFATSPNVLQSIYAKRDQGSLDLAWQRYKICTDARVPALADLLALNFCLH